MARQEATTGRSDDFTDSELRFFQMQLSALAQAARDYPLECELGSYALLFESRDDIESIVEDLGQSIAESQSLA
jgi:hypothetical protein